MKNKPFILLGVLMLTFVLIGCRIELSKSEWSKMYGFAAGEVFDIEIGKYGFPYIDTEILQKQIYRDFKK